jgi:hypothetical protein
MDSEEELHGEVLKERVADYYDMGGTCDGFWRNGGTKQVRVYG